MKKLLIITLIATAAAHAVVPGPDTIVDDYYSVEGRLAALPADLRNIAQAVIKKPVPENLPDVISLVVSWEDWRKARVADFYDKNLVEKRSDIDPAELQHQREWLIDNTILLSYNDPFSKAFAARPDKDNSLNTHGWRVVKKFMNAKTADVMIDWILSDFESLYKAAPREQQITYRMAVRSALDYLQNVDFAAETAYLEKLQSAKPEEQELAKFWEFNPDGSDRDFGHVKAFLYRRYADKTFTKDEMITLVGKIDVTLSK